jgi:hypothetical protein
VWARIAEALDEAPPALDLARITPRSVVPRTISLRVAAATMAAAAAIALFLGVALGRNDGGRLDRIEEQVQALGRPTITNAAYAALVNPQAEQIRLASTDGKATAMVVRLPDGTGYLVPTGLAKLPAGRVYQLWAVRSDAKISLGVIGQNPEVSAFRMNGPALAYAVTEEAPGGVGTTQNQPVVVGYVKA